MNAEMAEAKWIDEHPFYDISMWRHDVWSQDTKLGYWDWVAHNVEAEER